MKTTHSFGIDFLIRRCKGGNQKAIIYVRITVDEERKEISLKENIHAADWDCKQEMVKGKTAEAKALNQHIKDVEFSIRQHYRILIASQSQITAELIKQAYLGVIGRKKEHTLVELLDFFKKAWDPKLAEGNFKNYKTTVEYIMRFLNLNYTGNIFLPEVDGEFLTLLELYIRENPIQGHRPCMGNGLAKNIQRFKRIMNWSVELKWLSSNDIENYKCTVPSSIIERTSELGND